MQDLTVIGVDGAALVASSEDGSRFRIAIDDTLHSTIRRATPEPDANRKVPPREIQAQIRAGMSAEDVAAATGVSIEHVRKYEAPILAEREFVIESALNVPVHTAIDSDPMNLGSTFGSAIRDRLQDLGATGERWASWKEPDGGWVVKLSFSADQIDHDARWQFEPRKSALAPLNNEANTLSQQGEMPGGLIPRLRAVGAEERALDSSRFDSGAFDVKSSHGDVYGVENTPFGRASSPEVSAAAIKRAPVDEIESNQTADLLEALRRRRGERESANWRDTTADDRPERSTGSQPTGSQPWHPSTGSIRVVDVPLEDLGDTSTTAPQQFSVQARSSSRKGRAAMPSWDEIVFGARSDDDPA